jgi:hypothetical protein
VCSSDLKDPLKLVLDKGVHGIVGDEMGRMNVTCSHITFVGKGKDQTTIDGAFKVENQQNVKIESLTLTNYGGDGFVFEGSETTVDVLKCVVKDCSWGMFVGGGATVTATQCDFMENGESGIDCEGANTKVRLNDSTMHHNGREGLFVGRGATVTATQCEVMENGGHGVYCYGTNTKARLNDCQMHHNGNTGLFAYNHAVVDLHGTKTDIHSNKRGIGAGRRAKVNIHLPSQHNTSHDNVGEDRTQLDGGSIANINADGTFTHVVVADDDDDGD